METDPSPSESKLQDTATTFQADPNQPLSEAVLTAIASESEFDVLEIADEFGPLYDVIDPSALDSLFQSTERRKRAVGCVTFEYANYRITVDQTGRVELTNRQ